MYLLRGSVDNIKEVLVIMMERRIENIINNILTID
jgi:hypothetical protein